MIALRGGRGFGDAIYVQGVARHLVKLGKKLEIRTDWPDVFLTLNGSVVTVPFKRDRPVVLAHYSNRRAVTQTDQFVDCCISAGIKEPVEFKIDWKPVNLELVDQLKGISKPIVVVQMPRAPFGRADGYGLEFLPDCSVLQRSIDLIKDRAFTVQIGSGKPLFELSGIDLDLSNRTSVSDVMDIGYAASGFLGYCSFIVPLSESFSKPELLIWSRRGLQSQNALIRTITPNKVLHRSSSKYVIDDCANYELVRAVDALCEQMRSGKTV